MPASCEQVHNITYSLDATRAQMSLLCESFSARAFAPGRFSPGAFRRALDSRSDASLFNNVFRVNLAFESTEGIL